MSIESHDEHYDSFVHVDAHQKLRDELLGSCSEGIMALDFLAKILFRGAEIL